MTQLKALTDANFADAIAGETPVLVDFWAEWCGPCRLVSPILEEIGREHDTIEVVKMNIDENPRMQTQFGIMSIPTMILFKDGVEKKRIIGARPKASILQELAEYL